MRRPTTGGNLSTRPFFATPSAASGVKDLPVIFDLPLPLAIKRTEEFTRYVHPLLQAYCAKCHDGQYDGDFQLVPIRGRADRTSDALRANLDATLRLIDPKNPSHSVLLSSTLRPHGRGTKPRPIFPGLKRQGLQGSGRMGQSSRGTPGRADEAAHREASPRPDRGVTKYSRSTVTARARFNATKGAAASPKHAVALPPEARP